MALPGEPAAGRAEGYLLDIELEEAGQALPVMQWWHSLGTCRCREGALVDPEAPGQC